MQSARKTTETAARRADVARRYLHGEMQSAIAEALGVDQAQISRDLKALRAAWLTSSIRDFDAARAEELAKIDAVEAEYWAAWEKSKRPKTTRAAERGPNGRKVSKKNEHMLGNPAYLDGVLKCIERRCDLLGLDAPRRFVINWDDLTAEQEERLARGEAPEKVLSA